MILAITGFGVEYAIRLSVVSCAVAAAPAAAVRAATRTRKAILMRCMRLLDLFTGWSRPCCRLISWRSIMRDADESNKNCLFRCDGSEAGNRALHLMKDEQRPRNAESARFVGVVPAGA